MHTYSNEELYKEVLGLSKEYCKTSPPAIDCLEDDKRTLALMDIIANTVPQDCVATDLGTGTGILGFCAIINGAKEVYACDIRPDLVELSSRIAEKIGLAEKFNVYAADVSYFHPPKKIDYIIAELVETGLTAEPLVPAMKNIKKYAAEGALFLPETAISTVTVMQEAIQLSEPVVYDSVTFPANTREWVNCITEIPIIREGIATEITLNTRLGFPNGYATGSFDRLCSPINIASKGKKHLREGDVVRVKFEYYYGHALRIAFL